MKANFPPDVERILTRFLDKSARLGYRLSLRWQANANRRTLVTTVLVGLFAILFYLFVARPPDDFPVAELVSIPEGASLSETADDLESGGVIRSALTFRLLVTLLGAERTVHAGDYLFDEPLDIFAISRAIAIGTYGLEPVRIRIPEGASVKDMGTIFGVRLSRFNADAFLSKAQPLEGYLYPDTYFFLPNTTEDTVIEALKQNFETHLDAIRPTIASSTRPLSDLIIMASILEKEAYSMSDRRLIAGVLWNRISRGMALQVDAPFVYAIGKGTFQLTVKDLTTPSPYNTYVNKGLPPTPISNPSIDSILAAATPTKTDYLYFLADHNGITHYCKTYECHLANKAKYF